MKKKIIALLLIVCLVVPPLFADYEYETGVGVAALFSEDPWLIVAGIGLLVLVLGAMILPVILSAADEPSNGMYLASDDSSVVEQNEKKDSIFNHVKPVVDIRYSHHVKHLLLFIMKQSNQKLLYKE